MQNPHAAPGCTYIPKEWGIGFLHCDTCDKVTKHGTKAVNRGRLRVCDSCGRLEDHHSGRVSVLMERGIA